MSASTRRPVSCDPAIYADGGLYDPVPPDWPDARIERETLADLYASAAYSRPVAPERLVGRAEFVAELSTHYGWINEVFPRGPASALVRLTDCRLRDRSIHVRDPSGWRPLYETQRAVDLPYLHETAPGSEAETLPSDADYLHLDSAGSFNYGHFLVDDLARMRAIGLLPRRPGRVLRVLMTSHGDVIDHLRKAALCALAGAGALEVRLLDASRSYDVGTLHYPSPVTVHPAVKTPRALEDLAEAGRAAAEREGVVLPGRRSGRGAARLYVFRRPGRGRALANWPEIEAVLGTRRFRIIDPESMSFLEQVAFFADAELVVGPMGAAMANTLFCRPGARVLHLAPEGWTEPFFWDLAAVRGHHYGACYGPALGTGAPHLQDFTIDPLALAAALDGIG